MGLIREVVAAAPGGAEAAAAPSKTEMMVQTARGEFARLGYEAVSIRHVARVAGVSTRTLYDRFENKLGLFGACLDAGAATFPDPARLAGGRPDVVLRNYAVEIVRHLSREPSRQISQIVLRDSGRFPEIMEMAQANFGRFLLAPLVAYLRQCGIDEKDAEGVARLFCTVVTADWQSRLVMNRPPSPDAEIVAHAELAVSILVHGITALGAAR